MLNYAGGNPITAYNLQRSLRFRASASAYLSMTPATVTNTKTYTWVWRIKRGSIGGAQNNYFAGVSYTTSNYNFIGFENDTLRFYEITGGGMKINLVTNQVFRDPASWYDIVLAVDTTQATASNRVKLYVAGQQVTSFSAASYPAQNYDTLFNTNQLTQIGRAENAPGTPFYFDGYMAETYFIDGQALTPSSFGSTNSTTGVWQPAPYTGTYGTNGFYLPFTDNSALTTSSNVGLGKDFSGNGNYWVTNNISITSGVTYDSMTDVPTLTSATAANYCVLNPLINKNGNPGSMTNGNLYNTASSSSTYVTYGTMAIDSTFPKIYWEVKNVVQSADTNYPISGIANIADTQTGNTWFLTSGQGVGYYASGFVFNGGTLVGTFTAPNTSVTMYAYDPATGKFWVGTGGVWQNSGNPAAGTGQVATLATTNSWLPVTSTATSGTQSAINFGQQPFTYTPPSGFKALNTYNLPDSTIKQGNKVMDATLWAGDSTSPRAITNAAGFRPDLVWIKDRSYSWQHNLFDSVRGAGLKNLCSNTTDAEGLNASLYGYLSAFNSNGFQTTNGTDPTYPSIWVNNTTQNYVAWQWQAGQGTTSTNTNGTITSTVSVNASAGFSIVTYTGTGANATVGHGLGVAPSFIVVKVRNASTENWQVYSSALADATYRLILNSTSAVDVQTTMWNSTAPTSSVFSIGTATGVNANTATYVAYCFAQIPGYSAVGRYTGNGSADGPFIYCGFRPKFVLIKNISAVESWNIHDTSRSPYNQDNNTLFPNDSAAEYTGTVDAIDDLSNGFKVRNTGTQSNGNGNVHIYMAFAENPFKNALAR